MNNVLSIIFAGLLLLTFSKTSVIAMLIAVVAGTVVQRGWRKAKYIFFVLIAGVVACILLAGYIQSQIQAYTSNPSMVLTLTGRTVLWEWVLEMVSDRPLIGYGYACFRDIFEPYSFDLGFVTPATQAHNAFLDALFTGGYMGLAIFVVVLINAMVVVMKISLKYKGDPLAHFVVLITVFLLVRSLTEGALNLGRDFMILTAAAYLADRRLDVCK